MIPEHRRLTDALLLSLVIHALLLSLTFGGQGRWLPGFGFPWQDRRIEVPDLRVVVVPAQVTAAEPVVTPAAESLQQARVEPPVPSGPAPTPSVSRAPTPRRTAAATVLEVDRRAEANPKSDVATGAAPAKSPSRAGRPDATSPPPNSAPPVIAVEPTDEPTWVVPVTPPIPAPVITPAPSASSPETAAPSLRDAGDAARARSDQEARERADELAKLDAAKQEGQRQAEQQEVARQEAAREAAARAENARLEAERQEAARQVTDLEEAARQVAARQEAARVEAARVEAARIEAANAEAARAEAARADAARVEAARRAIGRQLDEEAARREAATAAARQSPPWSSARRYRLFGRADPNAEVILYAEAWSRKIQLNMTFDMVREAAKQPHADPLVTVAVRSDGSVESVTFVQSSGVAAIDEAIRGVVRSQTPYQVFPPGLAREFDVIEIRRTWHFDMAIRLE